MTLHIRMTEEIIPSQGRNDDTAALVEHYHRRVELSDAEAVARISRALDAELGKPARRVRSDKGQTRGASAT